MAETHYTVTYPPESTYQDWAEAADNAGMSVSEYIQAMVTAGRKKFDVDTSPDETQIQLREERRELRDELKSARERIAQLEARAYSDERDEIIQYVEDNPGADHQEIVNHLINTVPGRATDILDEMVGEELTKTPDGWEVSE